MQPVTITPITKMIRVRFSGKKVILPHHLQEHSNAYWHDLAANGKTYRRGEVFTVTQKDISDDAITVLVEKTDYAHYLYAQNHDDMGVHSIRIIHAAALVETSDKYFIFGKMGSHTARAGIYQLCGGGLDDGDLRGSDFDMTLNVTKELKEELGIDITDTTRLAFL